MRLLVDIDAVRGYGRLISVVMTTPILSGKF